MYSYNMTVSFQTNVKTISWQYVELTTRINKKNSITGSDLDKCNKSKAEIFNLLKPLCIYFSRNKTN